jgi:ABC-2 type transport system permease protein
MKSDPGPSIAWLPNFRGLSAFFSTELRVQYHEGLAIVTSVTVQVVLLVFVRILAVQLWGVALFGAIVFSFFGLGQRVLNEAAYVRVDHRLNQLYLASPLTPDSYFFGMSAGVLVAYLPPILILAGVAAATVSAPAITWVVLPLAILAVWLFSASFGYVLSTVFQDMRAIWAYSSILYNFFGVLPPVFYPIALVPTAARPLVLLLPPSAASCLLQWSLHSSALSGGEVALASTALAAEALGMFLFAIAWARRTVREE